MKKELQRRVTPDELDYLCKLRGSQKTHSDYSIEKGYTNYHVKVSKDEWKIILAQRAQFDYVETRTKDIIAHEARVFRQNRHLHRRGRRRKDYLDYKGISYKVREGIFHFVGKKRKDVYLFG